MSDPASSSMCASGRLDECSRVLLEAAGQALYGVDRAGRTTFLNGLAVEALGWRSDELIGRPHHTAVHHTRTDGTPYPREDCPIEAALREGRVHRGDGEWFWRKDGTRFEVEFTSTPLRERGEVVGAVVAFRDVTEQRRAERHLRQAALVFEHMPEGVVIADRHGRIESSNPALEAITGYTTAELAGRGADLLRSTHHAPPFYRELRAVLRAQGRWQGEIWIRRKDGEVQPEWLSLDALRDDRGRVIHYVGIFTDVSAHHEVKRRLHHLAYHDGLTGLPNRRLFADRLDRALAQARRSRARLAVMFIDLDRFKHINDALGHTTGDRMLGAVAERLRHAVRDNDTIARIGGDEFTVILSDLALPLAAGAVARKILRALERPFTIEGRELYISASIGISTYPEDGEDREALTRKADIAMYRAKELGRNNYQAYSRQMSEHFRRRVALEHDLRRALERDELRLLYQPLVEVRSGRIVGVEALARWRHPTLGDVPPSTFIPIAEETGLIDRIGAWGLLAACREAGTWSAAAGKELRVAVNVSAHQLRDIDFAALVAQVLERTGMAPNRLALELTESVLAGGPPQHRATLEALGRMGVEITIDDFGTGYSALSYLKRFAVHKLKIDRSFVRDIPCDANDRALASMIIAMAHASNMRVTAEGVERAAQLEFLRQAGCDEAQGFLFSAPVEAGRIATWCASEACLLPVHFPTPVVL